MQPWALHTHQYFPDNRGLANGHSWKCHAFSGCFLVYKKWEISLPNSQTTVLLYTAGLWSFTASMATTLLPILIACIMAWQTSGLPVLDVSLHEQIWNYIVIMNAIYFLLTQGRNFDQNKVHENREWTSSGMICGSLGLSRENFQHSEDDTLDPYVIFFFSSCSEAFPGRHPLPWREGTHGRKLIPYHKCINRNCSSIKRGVQRGSEVRWTDGIVPYEIRPGFG